MFPVKDLNDESSKLGCHAPQAYSFQNYDLNRNFHDPTARSDGKYFFDGQDGIHFKPPK